MGVFAGKDLSKNSGERTGPKLTLFLLFFLGGWPSLMANKSLEYERDRFERVEAGDGVQASSLSSGMDLREVESGIERRLLLRRERPPGPEGMGVWTFSELLLWFTYT